MDEIDRRYHRSCASTQLGLVNLVEREDERGEMIRRVVLATVSKYQLEKVQEKHPQNPCLFFIDQCLHEALAEYTIIESEAEIAQVRREMENRSIALDDKLLKKYTDRLRAKSHEEKEYMLGLFGMVEKSLGDPSTEKVKSL